MTEHNLSLQNLNAQRIENSLERPSAPELNRLASGEKAEASSSNSSDGQSQERYVRRSSRSKEKKPKPQPKNSRSGRSQHSKHKGRQLDRYAIEKILVLGCCFLGVVAVFVGGFYVGHKYSGHSDTSDQVVLQQDAAFPSPESDLELDAAFTALLHSKYSDALLKFQKVQQSEPTLFGLDYLIANSAYRAGENSIAEQAAESAISKNEDAQEARVLQALINSKKTSDQSGVAQLADPNTTLESEIKQLVATHLGDARVYGIWGDFLRSNGSYRSAVDIFHKGVLRADPSQTEELLSAKEKLAALQNKPAQTAPSLSEMTSMTGEQALVAAFACIQLKQGEEASSFLEHARDLYPPQIFRELMNDGAFADYRTNPQLSGFFKTAR
jgi:tetratricopeptide (TPR) repeat protein